MRSGDTSCLIRARGSVKVNQVLRTDLRDSIIKGFYSYESLSGSEKLDLSQFPPHTRIEQAE